MKTLVIIFLSLLLWFCCTREAECIGCASDRCYSDFSCGIGCSCVTIGTDPMGYCVGGRAK